MYKYTLLKKTGFKVPPTQNCEIYDFRGVLFYSNSLLKNKTGLFNLPEGVFYSDTKLIRLMFPIKNKKIYLPKPQRIIKLKKPLLIQFAVNKNKATINYNDCTITFDNQFKLLPLPEIMFTYYHELGHLYYNSEKFADLYAVRKMLQKGYNRSQIGKASFDLLSTRAYKRKLNVLNNLI